MLPCSVIRMLANDGYGYFERKSNAGFYECATQMLIWLAVQHQQIGVSHILFIFNPKPACVFRGIRRPQLCMFQPACVTENFRPRFLNVVPYLG